LRATAPYEGERPQEALAGHPFPRTREARRIDPFR
jgi:hypothetical protein